MHWLIKAAVSEPESLYNKLTFNQFSRQYSNDSYLFTKQVSGRKMNKVVLLNHFQALCALTCARAAILYFRANNDIIPEYEEYLRLSSDVDHFRYC